MVTIEGENKGIVINGDAHIDKVEFEFGKGIKSAEKVMARVFNINGKQYDSVNDMAQGVMNDPQSNVLVWEYIRNITTTFVNGKWLSRGDYGKCIWNGKAYEGEIEYIDGWIYVGGEKVKEE